MLKSTINWYRTWLYKRTENINELGSLVNLYKETFVEILRVLVKLIQ